MPTRDTRVDDGHADAGTGVAHEGDHRSRADRDRRSRHIARHRPVMMNVFDPRVFGQLFQQPIRHAQHPTIHPLEARALAAKSVNNVGIVASVGEFDDDIGFTRTLRSLGAQFPIELALGRRERRARRRFALGGMDRPGCDEYQRE